MHGTVSWHDPANNAQQHNTAQNQHQPTPLHTLQHIAQH